jgi:hypothetical protein
MVIIVYSFNKFAFEGMLIENCYENKIQNSVI